MLSIPEFYSGKNVLITGASGFVGKYLLEKLLSSCPDIGNIYILVRAKKGTDAQDRIKQITDNVLFDYLKEKDPACFKKLIVVPGNTQELGLGISEEYEKLLISNVHIIYHCAAKVNFDMTLQEAIISNVRASRELAGLALKCKNIQVLVHVSTMYSNCDEDVIDEKVYPSKLDWRDVIKLGEDESLAENLQTLSLKYIYPFPNTYTFSKKISEQIFMELCKDKVPLVICRPSIIIYALGGPVPGWQDNLNGPFSLLLGTTKGIMDVVYGNKETGLDKVFVDNIVKTLIMSTWKKCMDSENTKEVTVYNACSDFVWKIKYYFLSMDPVIWNVPMENRFFWGGKTKMTSSWYYYYFLVIIFNVIPGLLGDLALKLSGKKVMIFRYQRKIYVANLFLLYFMKRTFLFLNKGYVDLENKIMDCDKADFAFRDNIPTYKQEDIDNMAHTGILGLKRFVLHEKYPIAPETYANTNKFYVLHLIVTGIKFVILWYVIWRWTLPMFWNKMNTYISYLQ